MSLRRGLRSRYHTQRRAPTSAVEFNHTTNLWVVRWKGRVIPEMEWGTREEAAAYLNSLHEALLNRAGQ